MTRGEKDRLDDLSERVVRVETKLDPMEQKVNEMHALMLKAQGWKLALMLLYGTVATVAGVVGTKFYAWFHITK